MEKKTMSSAEISLPYFKQGDDLRQELESNSTILNALESHAQSMDCAARMLREIKEMIADFVSEVEIQADTHMIEVSGPPTVIEKLIAANLAYKFDDEEFDDEEEDDFEEYDEMASSSEPVDDDK